MVNSSLRVIACPAESPMVEKSGAGRHELPEKVLVRLAPRGVKSETLVGSARVE